MFVSDPGSFYFKFKSLLHAALTIKCEAGWTHVSLSQEDIGHVLPEHPHQLKHARNGPSQQRRCDRCAEERTQVAALEAVDRPEETADKPYIEKVSDKPSAVKALKENSKELNPKDSESVSKVDASKVVDELCNDEEYIKQTKVKKYD